MDCLWLSVLYLFSYEFVQLLYGVYLDASLWFGLIVFLICYLLLLFCFSLVVCWVLGCCILLGLLFVGYWFCCACAVCVKFFGLC